MPSHQLDTLGRQGCVSPDSHSDFLLTISEGPRSEEVFTPLTIDQLPGIFGKECISGFYVHGEIDRFGRRKPELQMI